jgi:membrane protease YdiL (CAAX protease family)
MSTVPSTEQIDRATVLEFLALAYGISWGGALALVVAGVEYGSLVSTAVVVVVFMWAPAIAAIVVRVRAGRSIRSSCGFTTGRRRWLAVGWLAPAALLAATVGVGAAIPGVSITTDYAAFLQGIGFAQEQIDASIAALESLPVPPVVVLVGQGLVAGVTINAVAALGEELGWRGLLLTELSPLGFWPLSILTGVVWGLWHAPLILQGHNFPTAPVVGVLLMTLWTVAISPVFTYLTVRARSVLAPTLFHGSFNAVGSLSLVYLTGAGRLVTAPVGIAGIGSALVAVGCCLAHDRFVATEPIITSGPVSPWE